MKNFLSHAFTAGLILFSRQALAQSSARELLDKARDYVAAAPAIRRIDTSEQSVVLMVGGSRMAQTPQTNVVTIEIDMPKLLARQTAMIQDQPLIMLKQGEKAAIEIPEEAQKILSPANFPLQKPLLTDDLSEGNAKPWP